MIARYYPRGKFIALNILSFLSSAENIAIAFMVAGLTNIATTGQVHKLPVFVGEVAIFLLIVLVSQLGYNYLRNDAIRSVNQLLRSKILRGMFAHSRDNAEDLGFLTNDFKLLETNRFGAELNIISAVSTLVLSFGYALYINWALTIVFFIGASIPLFISNFFQNPIKNASTSWSAANSRYVAQTKNFLSGAPSLHLYEKEENAVSRNKSGISALENSLMRMNLLNANAQTTVSFIAEFTTFLVPFVIGVLLIINGFATLGALFAVMQLSNTFVNPILQILSERNNFSTTKEIVNKVNGLIHKADESTANTPIFEKSLEMRNITLARGDVQLSSGMDISITPGKKIAIIGPSGCGKSTLLQFMMNGQYGTADKSAINGVAVEMGTFAHNFGYASQAPVIFADTLEFNLTLGSSLNHDNIENVCANLHLDDVIRDKGLQYDLGENADQLSGGQLARIELARAILSERPILLLDEINASLDQETSDAVHHYLLNSDLTFVEVIHHYQPEDLEKYDEVIDFSQYAPSGK